MKKNKFSILILLLATVVSGFAQTTIEIVNQYPFDRTDEIVEIAASELGGLSGTNYVLTDENGQEIPYQLIYNGTESVQALRGGKAGAFLPDRHTAPVPRKGRRRTLP